LLYDFHVMPGDAAADRAQDRVVAGIVTRDGARRPAREATDRTRRRYVQHWQETEAQGRRCANQSSVDFHLNNPLVMRKTQGIEFCDVRNRPVDLKDLKPSGSPRKIPAAPLNRPSGRVAMSGIVSLAVRPHRR
jgi:hypothetical protein